MNPKLFFSMLFATPSGCKLILIFNLSKTSAEPHFDDKALFPCLATFIPILARSRAEAVDIFKVFFPSPPVQQVSIIYSTILTFRAFSLKTYTPPAISSDVSPFLDRLTRKLKISAIKSPLI